MRFELFNPWVLVGLIAVAVCVIAAWRSFAGLGRVQRVLHLTLRALTVLALLAAISGVTVERSHSRPGTHLVILAPHYPQGISRPLPFFAAIRNTAGENDRVDLARDDAPLTEQLRRVSARLGADVTARVLVADSLETGDDATLAAARRLRRRDIPVDVLPITFFAEASASPGVVSASVDGECRAGVPFEVRLGADSPRTLTRTFAEPGVQLVRGTSSEERWALPVWIAPAIRVLILRDEATPVDPLTRVLTARGVQTQVLIASSLPTSALPWNDHDAVLLVNVAATDLGEARQAALSRYVFNGGGLVMVGGWKSFGCGGYYKGALERALPVYMDPLRDPPSYALLVVMDKSWSMGDAVSKSAHKVDLVREVSIAATTPFTTNDFFGLISFDSQPHLVLELRKLSDRKLATKTISTLGAFGTTNFYRAMSKAFDLLRETKATYKHIVLLSDGRSSVPNLNYQTLVGDMTKKRVTVSTVGVGEDCHRQLLADIAAWGKGKNYHIATADRIPQILLEESNRLKEILTVEVPSPVKVKTDDAVLTGIDAAKLPDLLGFNRVRAKESADVVLTVSHKDEPLLVLWHYGTGRAAAFASDAGERWSVDWIAKRADDFARLWQEIVLTVARPAPSANSSVRIVADDRTELIHHAADAWGLPVSGLTLQAKLHRWPGDTHLVEAIGLTESQPGVYRARLARRPEPPYLLRIVDAEANTHAVLTAPRVDLTPLTEDERRERARKLARAGGGRVNPTPEDLFQADERTVTRRTDVRPTMLVLALAFWFLDVVVRRSHAVTRLIGRT